MAQGIWSASYVWVALGGGIGAVLRHSMVQWVARVNPVQFPLGTVAVNLLGSLLMGVFMAKWGHSTPTRLLLMTGLLGGFTTFSAFSWDAWQLLSKGYALQAALYIGGSVGLSVAAVAMGFQWAR